MPRSGRRLPEMLPSARALLMQALKIDPNYVGGA